jgi:thymidylate synthase
MSVLWLIVPGFGEPNVVEKRRILAANIETFVRGPWERIILQVHVYDATQLDVISDDKVHATVFRRPGIVGQFLEQSWSSERPLHHDHVCMLLDDVELLPDVNWALAARVLADYRFDVLSPALTQDSPTGWDYMRAVPARSPFSVHVVNACEMFCYLATPTAFDRWMSHYDKLNPWIWGMDLIIVKHMRLRVGLLQQMTARHHFKDTCYMQHPSVDPMLRMHVYLAKYGETMMQLRATLQSLGAVAAVVALFQPLGAQETPPPAEHPEQAYLGLLRRLLRDGEARAGRNGKTRGLFGEVSLHFPASAGFPLLTTKRIFFRGVAEELLWFLRGQTNAQLLQDKGVHIWDGNSSRAFLDAAGLAGYPEGECGTIYGWQWRRFNAPFSADASGQPVAAGAPGDQLAYLLRELAADPHSRRAVLSAWNPLQLATGALPPCHVLYQFSLRAGGLACHMYQRSADAFLGLPFNIASTALLTHLVAAAMGLPVDGIRLSFGDLHIYDAHIDAVREQLKRRPHAFPRLEVTPPAAATVAEKVAWMESRTRADLTLLDYTCHAALPAPMVA